MKNKKLFLGILSLLGMMAVAGCAPKDKGLIVELKNTNYVEGQTIAYEDITVQAFVNGKYVEVSDFEYDLENMELSVEDAKVVVTYGDKTAEVAINVMSKRDARTGIELIVQPGYEYVRGAEIADAVKYREVYSNATYGKNTTLYSENIKVTLGDVATITATVELNNREYTATTTCPIKPVSYITVKELLEGTVEEKYSVKGVVSGFVAISPYADGVVLFDKANDKYITVRGLVDDTHFYSGQDTTGGLKVGDEVGLEVTLKQSGKAEVDADSEMIYAAYNGEKGDLTSLVISSNNDTTPNYENAILITNDKEFKAAFATDNLPNVGNKLIRLHGRIGVLKYNGFERIYFADDVNSYSAQKFYANCSPVFANAATKATTGTNTFGIFTGDETRGDTEYGTAVKLTDCYVVFCGGSTWYAGMCIMHADDVKEITPLDLGYELVAPTKVVYNAGETFDLTGGKIVHKYDFKANEEIALTKEMITGIVTDGPLAAGDYTVTATYNGVGYPFEVKVAAGLDHIGLTTTLLNGTIEMGVEDVIALFGEKPLVLYYGSGSTENVALTADMINFSKLVLGKNTFTVTYLGKTVGFEVNATIGGMSVPEALAAEVNEHASVHGIIIGQSVQGPNSSTTIQWILKDEASNAVMALKSVPADVTLAQGDKVSIQGKLVIGIDNHEKNRKWIEATDAITVYAKCATEAEYQLDLADPNIIEVNNQVDFLTTFMTDGVTDFTTQYYKIYKFGPDLRAIAYSGGPIHRIFFGGVTANGGDDLSKRQYLPGLTYNSPVVKANSFEANTGLTFANIFTNTVDYANATPSNKIIYAIAMAGTGTYYYDFAVPGAYCVQDVQDEIVSTKVVAPTKASYAINDKLDLTGAAYVETYKYAGEVPTALTELMILPGTEPNMAVPATYTVSFKIREGVTCDVEIVVNGTVDHIAIANPTAARFIRSDATIEDVAALLNKDVLTVTYEGGATSEATITKEMVSYTGTITVGQPFEVTITLNGKTTVVTLTGDYAGYNVSELAAEVADTTIHGVIIGYSMRGNNGNKTATDGNYKEYALKDLHNDTIIGLWDLALGETEPFVRGDVLVLEHVDVAIGGSSNANRLTVKKAAATVATKVATMEEKDYKLDLTKAIVVTNQTEFLTVVKNDMASCAYKLFKLENPIAYSAYADIYRLGFEGILGLNKDADGNTYPINQRQYLVGSTTNSPVICVHAFNEFSGTTIADVFGTATGSTTATPCGYDIYFVCMGGTGAYYLDFAVFGSYMLSQREPA